MLCYLLELVYDLALDREISKQFSEAVGFESPLGYYAFLGQQKREEVELWKQAERFLIEQDDSYEFQYSL